MLVNVTLDLPEDVYNLYNERSENKDISKALSDRLVKCANHAAEKGLYIDDGARQKLDNLLGYNISSTEQLLDLVEKIVSMKVGSVRVPLKSSVLTRLKSRCYGMEFPEFVKQQVTRDLEVFTGLR